MSEFRRDPITGRWIIVATDTPRGPDDFERERHTRAVATCPFCPGNEAMTPPEIGAVRPVGGAPNGPGWRLRMIPNKFPALRIEGDLNRAGEGVYDLMNGIGAHEVIIETPDHLKDLADLSDAEIEQVIRAYQTRSLDLRGDRRFQYLLIFKNYGETAGASLVHAHSQLIALPIVPKRVKEELQCADHYFEYKDRCVFCDMIQQESDDRERVVLETAEFICFAPFVSRFPFELWIMPKAHAADFGQITEAQIVDLAGVMRHTLQRVKRTLHDPSYNFLIHTAPVTDHIRGEYHWHLEMMPRLTRVAGFEWGSGFYINPTPPEAAANYLRESA
ncbi:MAG: galactose-1-phosphate uridylyltransferase [Candidatus Omnitrophica bacterium]|nr:galactose-1-phosphate uridylyltransferase [Candidatus Omnitrophota bacterium]